MTRFPRITVDPFQMGGVPCVRGLRLRYAAAAASELFTFVKS